MAGDDPARGVTHFKIVQGHEARFHWELINPHGTPMGRAMESFDTQRYVSHWHVWFTVFVARFSPTNRRVLRCFLDLARFSLIRSHISTTKCLCYGRFIAI